MRIQTYDQTSRAASSGRQSYLTHSGKIVLSSSSRCLCMTSSCC